MCAKTTLNMEKTVHMRDFISYAVSLLWVKLCYGASLRNVWRVGLQNCSQNDAFGLIYTQRLLNFPFECLYYAT